MLERAPVRYRLLIETAIFTGMRISELRGLTWDCVDFERKLIQVRQRAHRFNKIGTPKSSISRRSIPMALVVVVSLSAWQPLCPEGDLNLGYPNWKGKIENHLNIHNRVLVPLLVENGIADSDGNPKFSYHALRHAAAPLFIEKIWSLKKGSRRC